MSRICAVIVTYNRVELLKENLEALLAQKRKLDGILIVDNASTDETVSFLRESKYLGEWPSGPMDSPFELTTDYQNIEVET